MQKLSINARSFLLKLARDSIVSEFARALLKRKDIPKEVQQKAGTFVTLTKNGELRGCIGIIDPIQPMYRGVAENAKAAAFSDPRFENLSEAELKHIQIEVSVLSVPQKLHVRDVNNLVQFLKASKPGLILEYGNLKATFLPQVWKDLGDPPTFLTHLCLKAGISSDMWKRPEVLTFYSYEVDHFSEDTT